MNNRHRQVAKWNAYYMHKKSKKLLDNFMNIEESMKHIGITVELVTNVLNDMFGVKLLNELNNLSTKTCTHYVSTHTNTR